MPGSIQSVKLKLNIAHCAKLQTSVDFNVKRIKTNTKKLLGNSAQGSIQTEIYRPGIFQSLPLYMEVTVGNINTRPWGLPTNVIMLNIFFIFFILAESSWD